jgi:hypothetical protein
MLGSDDEPGIIFRSVQKLFCVKKSMESRSDRNNRMSISVEMLEIYNETVRIIAATSKYLFAKYTEHPFISILRFGIF